MIVADLPDDWSDDVSRNADADAYLAATLEHDHAATSSNGDEPAAAAQVVQLAPRTTSHGQAVDGASFILNEPANVPACWGTDDQVIWAEGEPLMIVGPDGVGKTTVAQQLVLARIGVTGKLLGHPVHSTGRRVLYIAADRPRQAARSFARMTSILDERELRERLTVWRGPLPFDITTSPSALAALAVEHGCTDIVIDSLKDVAPDLSTDETGSRVNIALQHVIAQNIELCVLHHQRKEGRDNSSGKPKKLADVYGSRWLTAGMGSVLLLWGEPGDPLVELLHLKQPAEDIGPLRLLHDHTQGRTTIETNTSVQEILLEHAASGLEVRELAVRLHQRPDPSRTDIEKARRRLESLVTHGHATRTTNLHGKTIYQPAQKHA